MKKGIFGTPDEATGFIHERALFKVFCCSAILYESMAQHRVGSTFSKPILRPGNWIMPGRVGVGGRKSGRKSRRVIITQAQSLLFLKMRLVVQVLLMVTWLDLARGNSPIVVFWVPIAGEPSLRAYLPSNFDLDQRLSEQKKDLHQQSKLHSWPFSWAF